jgi:NitT/TauT family transport system ATP-binding protein
MSAAIHFRDVDKAYRRPHAVAPETILQGFSFDIRRGGLVAIVGASGIGKTTLLHLAAGLERPDAGVVDIDTPRPRVGMVFQQPRLFDWLSVGKNIDIVADAAGVDPARGRRLLADVGLSAYVQAFPLSLSGGQRQRVSLARAFAVEPEIILLDEPFSAVDELTARRLRLVLQELWLGTSPTGLLVTHNTLEAAFLADRVLVLAGRPARIAKIIDIDQDRPRQPEDPKFFEIHREILATLENDGDAPPASIRQAIRAA